MTTSAPFRPNKPVKPNKPVSNPQPKGLKINKIEEPDEPHNGQLANLKARLNGGTVLSPLLTALMLKPGLTSDSQKLKSATDEITSLHKEVVRKIQQALSPDDNHPAITATIARPLAYVVSDVWQTTPDNQKIEPDKLAETYLDFMDQSTPTPDMVFTDLPKALDRSLCEARAMVNASGALLRLQNKDPQKKRLGKLMLGDQQTYAGAYKYVGRNLIDKTEQTLSSIVSESMDDKHKDIAFKSVLSSLSKVYGQALVSEFNALGKQLQLMNADQRNAYLTDLPDHPDGILLERATNHLETATNVLYPPTTQAYESENRVGQPRV